jgi:hypothetical protein
MVEATLAPIYHYQPKQPARRTHPATQARKTSLWLFAVPVVVFILRFFPSPFADLAYVITFIYALTGRRQAVVSLMMLCLLNLATQAFGMPPHLAVIYRHPIVLAAAVSTMVLHGGGISRTRCPQLLIGTSIVCGLIMLHSALISEVPVLSILKCILFSLAILALFAGWGGLSDEDRRLGEIQIWGIVGALTVLSAPMLLTPLGYHKGSKGFQGLITHAQPFGCMMGVYATFLWLLFLSRRKLGLGLLILAVMATAYVYLSQARIGGLTLVAGLVAGVVVAPLIPRLNRLLELPRLRFSRVAVLAALLGFAAIATGGLLTAKVTQFVMKYGSAENATAGEIGDALYRSRGGVLERMLESVRQKPLTGIGFGVPTEGGRSSPIVYDPIFHLPIMAAVEKGVMPVAVLEELGVPLAIVVYLWLAFLFVLAARGGVVSLGAFSASLAINAAEAVFFSPGGPGMFFLVIVGMAVTAGYYSPKRTAHSPQLRSPQNHYVEPQHVVSDVTHDFS